ncbi:conserved hypothetical protein [Burkholderiales bacterium 8X]|nr:conserved hypothetical protein [Burkholderiales bacterium 8X]
MTPATPTPIPATSSAAFGNRLGLEPQAPLSSLRLLALLCVALPLVAFIAVGSFRFNQVRAETELRIDRTLRVAYEHALKALDTNDAALARVQDLAGRSDAPLLRNREQLVRQLQGVSANKPQLGWIGVVDANGRLLASDGPGGMLPGGEAAQAELVRWHGLHGDELRISDLVRDPDGSDAFFLMSRRRLRADGSFGGAFIAALPVSHFQQFHGDLAADEPGLAITVFRADGLILSRFPNSDDALPRMAPDGPVLSRVVLGETRGQVIGVSSVDARRRLLAFGKIGDYPLYIGTGMNMSEIWQRWLQEMAWLAGFGIPPMLGLYFSARIALNRTRTSLETAARLQEETQARQRVEEALVQAQKLEALGRLTGGVAHDFNNALMVISSNLYLLKRKHPETTGRYAESIGRAVASATKLTRQLLAFSRRQALVPEQVDLRVKLPELKALLGPVLGAQSQLTLEVSPDTRPILVDAAELELALLNLAINARDAMGARGHFSVLARNATDSLPPLLEGPMVLVEAVDDGPGIDPALLDKVFEPFFTTKPVGEGTGLGLSQVYGLCQRAGGAATIHSEVGKGTTVRLWFPAVPLRDEAPAVVARTQDTQIGKTILLVEDNDEVAAALVPMLGAMDCKVHRFDRAAAALEWLSGQQELPDLLLTDVVMPGEMDGAGLAQQVRARFPELRILLMTGYAEQIDAITKLGFEVLPKPCSAEMLAEAIGGGSTAVDAPTA